MFRRTALFLSVCLALIMPVRDALADMVVIVNARSGVGAMTRSEVANIFFGRNRAFFNGVEARPVDLAPSNPVRARFYKALVGKEIADIDAYWSRQVFSGRMQAPPRLATSDEVVNWVATNPGGIGYVEIARTDARVRIVYEFPPGR